jgi:hypothetical protein
MEETTETMNTTAEKNPMTRERSKQIPARYFKWFVTVVKQNAKWAKSQASTIGGGFDPRELHKEEILQTACVFSIMAVHEEHAKDIIAKENNPQDPRPVTGKICQIQWHRRAPREDFPTGTQIQILLPTRAKGVTIPKGATGITTECFEEGEQYRIDFQKPRLGVHILPAALMKKATEPTKETKP